MASSVVRSMPRCAYWTMAPGPGSRLSLVSPSSMKRPPEAATCLATMNRAPAVPIKVSLTSPPCGEVGGKAAGWGESCLRNLREWGGRLLAEVALIELRHPLEGVYLLDRLVIADADDARKPQRVSAEVPS